MKGIKQHIAKGVKYMAKGGEVGDPAFDVNDPNSYLKISPEDKALFAGLTDEQMLSVFGNYAPTIEADDEKLKSLQTNFLSNYKGTAQYYVPKKGFTVKKDYDEYLSTITPKATETATGNAGTGVLASTAFKPKYPRVGTPEWEANQSVIEAERQKRTLYKAEGGVIDSTLETDEVVRGAKSKKTSSKGVDIAHDVLLGTAEMSMPFAPDLIKEKDYKSKYGANINKNTHGIGTVANSTAEGILHTIFPFTAGLSAGKKAVVGAVSSPDDAITKEQRDQEATASMGGNMLGSATGIGINKGMFKKNGNKTVATQSTPTTEQDVQGNEETVFDPNTLQDSDIEGYNAAPDKAAYLKAIGYYDGTYQKKASGGKIVGPGTAKSDDIPSKLETDGWVIPAENAAKAEALREKYFGKPKKIASLRGGDQKVMVSNGEHYFTPEEVAILEANGEDLSALAPNAKDKTDEYKCGGGVKKMAKGGPVDGKNKKKTYTEETNDLIKDAEEKLKDSKSKKSETKKTENPNLKKSASEWSKNAVNRSNTRKDLREKLMAIELEAVQLDNKYKEYLKVIKDPNASATAKRSAKENIVGANRRDTALGQGDDAVLNEYVKRAKKYKDDIKNILNEKMYWDNDKNFDPVTNEPLKKNSLKSEDLKVKTPKVVDEKTTTTIPPAPAPKTTTGTGSGVKGAVDKAATTKTTTTPTTEEKKPETTTTTGAGVTGKTDAATKGADDTEDNTPTYEGLENGYFSGDKPAPKKETSGKKGIFGDGTDIEKAIALGQAGLGIQQLLNDGPRPVDQLDPEFTASVEQAKKDAEFGMSPLERSIAERNMVRQQRGGVRAIVQQSAGNSQQAINSIIALNNEAANNAQLLSLRSEQLLADKKRYRDTLIGEQSAMKKQLFNEKLDAFNIDQQAGANLVGAGIANYIGATRYQKQLEADKDIEARKYLTVDPIKSEQLYRVESNTNTSVGK